MTDARVLTLRPVDRQRAAALIFHDNSTDYLERIITDPATDKDIAERLRLLVARFATRTER